MFSLNRIPVMDKASAAISVSILCREKFSEDIIVEKLSDQMNERAQQVVLSVGPKDQKEFTFAIREADFARDRAFKSLIKRVESYAIWSPLNDKKKIISEFYNRISDGGLSFIGGRDMAESTILAEKLDYMKNDGAKPVVEALSLNPWIENLQVENNNFNTLYEARSESKDEIPEPLHVVEPPLNRAISALKSYLLSNYEVENIKSVFDPLMVADAKAKAKQTQKDNKQE
jgi:Family of unknown function (DUF6261)